MNDQGKKMNPEETPKDEKIQLTDDEAEKAAGGAGFTRVDRPGISKTPNIKHA